MKFPQLSFGLKGTSSQISGGATTHTTGTGERFWFCKQPFRRFAVRRMAPDQVASGSHHYVVVASSRHPTAATEWPIPDFCTLPIGSRHCLRPTFCRHSVLSLTTTSHQPTCWLRVSLDAPEPNGCLKWNRQFLLNVPDPAFAGGVARPHLSQQKSGNFFLCLDCHCS